MLIIKNKKRVHSCTVIFTLNKYLRRYKIRNNVCYIYSEFTISGLLHFFFFFHLQPYFHFFNFEFCLKNFLCHFLQCSSSGDEYFHVWFVWKVFCLKFWKILFQGIKFQITQVLFVCLFPFGALKMLFHCLPDCKVSLRIFIFCIYLYKFLFNWLLLIFSLY